MPLNYNFSHDDSIPSDEQQATFYYQNDTDDDDVDDVDRMELRRLRLQLHQSSSSLTYSTATDDFHYKDIVKIDDYVDIQSSQTQKRRATVLTYPPPTSASIANLMTTTTDNYHQNQRPRRLIVVAVGSENKAKLKSVRTAMIKLFPEHECRVYGFTVPSGVSAQPMSDSETMEGALNRARAALQRLHSLAAAGGNVDGYCQSADCDRVFGVGLEGGVQKSGERWFESGWCCVVDGGSGVNQQQNTSNGSGRVGYGSSGRFELSAKIMQRLIEGGQELAEVIDEFSGRTDVRSGDGAMGVLTNGHLPRAEAYLHGVLFAFAPLISPDVYWR